jgi:hypothetical protein
LCEIERCAPEESRAAALYFGRDARVIVVPGPDKCCRIIARKGASEEDKIRGSAIAAALLCAHAQGNLGRAALPTAERAAMRFLRIAEKQGNGEIFLL